MRALPLLLCIGCTSSLSNDVFFEDARFLSALPSDAKSAPPEVFDSLEGSAELIVYAQDAVAEVDQLTHAARAAAASLRGAVPDERSDVHRRWSHTAVILNGPEGAVQAWTRGEVLLVAEDETEWTIEIAASEDGPWDIVGSGHQVGDETASEGAWTWRSGVESTLTMDPRGGIYELAYTIDPSVSHRETSIATRPDLLSPPTAEYRLVHDVGIVFPAEFTLTDEPLSGVAAAFHTEDGGRADGFLAPDSSPFTACWGPTGEGLYLGPESTVTGYGDESGCALESVVGR